ncbi:MAG: DinB family protein [Bacillota bacterium]
MLTRILQDALEGRGSHVSPTNALDGLDWELAGRRPPGSPHSIWEILQHMIFWQDFFLAWMRGERPAVPATAAASWPDRTAPEGAAEWEGAVARFQKGLAEAMAEAEKDLEATIPGSPGHSRADALVQLIGHNSYHLGQIVLLRRQLGAWPPPGGGDTW